MSTLASVRLLPKKARPFFGRHPWLFEGNIDKVQGDPAAGAVVKVFSAESKFIAYGLYNPHSKIRVRLYSWDEAQPLDNDLIRQRLRRAIAYRHEDLGLDQPQAGYRLVFSEADGLSGLTVDRYGDYACLQFTSLALHQFEPLIVETLMADLPLQGLLRRTERGIGELEHLEIDEALLAGSVPQEPIAYQENGMVWFADLWTGQKTGAFLDQRDNRLALCRYTAGRSVLDLFCYTGGFGLTAMKYGAADRVLGVDASGPALGLAQRNAEANDVAAEFFQGSAVPTLQQFVQERRKFGVVICDPPKFARSAGAVENALRGYEQINRLALEVLEPGGILLTCSCSGHVTAEGVVELLTELAQKTERELHLLEIRGQAPDHYTSVYCQETAYLKCIIARVAN